GAMNNLEKVLSIKPRRVDAFTHVILVHAAKKEYSRALERCDRQLELYGDSPVLRAMVYNLKGTLYLARG
ncbi:unnamed protein product, partial [marine sediment metagenome]